MIDLSETTELDLTVFESEFDPHHRGRQCVRTIERIRANLYSDGRVNGASNPLNGKKVTPFNQKKLLEYASDMIRKIKRNEFSTSSFEKNLSESWRICLVLEKNIDIVTEQDIKELWEIELLRYESKDIAHATLIKKYECFQRFIKWVNNMNGTGTHPLMQNLDVPRAPKRKLIEEMPTQEDAKKLIDAVRTDGKNFTIRDQAILALANDSGARISEILSVRNKHIKPEKNYLVVSFPESKTMPRTVISFLAKPYLEEWAKISPNKGGDPNDFFFCQRNGAPIIYNAIKKSFDRALEKTGIPWPKGKAMHFFRSLFASRAYDWGYTQKHYWVGWAFKDHERSYTQLSYQACVDVYFKMLKRENNPFLREDSVFWEEEKIDETIIKKLLEEKPEFRLLLRQVIRETMGNQD